MDVLKSILQSESFMLVFTLCLVMGSEICVDAMIRGEVLLPGSLFKLWLGTTVQKPVCAGCFPKVPECQRSSMQNQNMWPKMRPSKKLDLWFSRDERQGAYKWEAGS